MAVCELGTFLRTRCQTTASRCAGDFRCHSANQGHCKRYRCAFSKSLSYETLEDMTDKRKRHSMHKISSNPEVQFTKTFWCFFLVSCLLFSADERLHRRRFAPANCWPFGHGTSGTLAQKRVDWTMLSAKKRQNKKMGRK